MDDASAPTANDQPPPLSGPSQAENTPHGGSESPPTQSAQETTFSVSKRLAFNILSLALGGAGGGQVLPHWHAWKVFLSHIIGSVPAARLIETDFPWVALVKVLNGLLVWDDADLSAKMNARFPSAVGHPLPEDYNLRGFDWAQGYLHPYWFEDARIGSEERTQELPSMTSVRRERILWLTVRICGDGDWLAYSAETRSFSVHPALRQRLEASKAAAAAATFQRAQSDTEAPSEEPDVDMAASNLDGDDCYVVVMYEDATKPAPVVTTEAIAVVTRSTTINGPEALHLEYTACVFDANFLLAHLVVGWPVVVPNSGNITPTLR